MNNVKLTLALMAGLPGTGKSTLAFELGKKLDWTVIDKDASKAAFLNDESASLDDKSASLMAYEESFRIAEDELIKQKSVILDSAALDPITIKNARETAAHVEKKIEEKVQIKVILCVIDKHLRDYRVRRRPQQVATVQVDPETIADYLALFKHLPSNTLTIYTNGQLEEYLETAISYLRNTQNSTERSYEPRYKILGG